VEPNRFGSEYPEIATKLDWSAYSGSGGGFQGAVEMCNNNGACRALAGGVMCPSYRVTREERDVTRGRANTLRLAITGQLGPDAFTSDEMAETMKLCVSCKACRRECPTGVDMARMKIEVQAARVAKHGLSLRDRLVGYLPRYAPYAARWPDLANLRDDKPRLKQWSETYAGLSTRRTLPRWRSDAWREPSRMPGADNARAVVFFADTFNRYFEPENIAAALAVLAAAGCGVHLPKAVGRPLCCGRTFLAVGLVDEARLELRLVEHRRDSLLNFRDDGRRRSVRCEQSEPGQRLDIREARFAERWNLRM
jgi:Fe-S oxidoreductase